MNNFFIPCASVRPSRIVQYQYWNGDRKKSNHLPVSTVQKSTISKKASQRLESAIYLLCESAATKRIWDKDHQRWFSFKVNFLTLTLPSKQIHEDSDILRSIFKPFIRWWRDKNPSLLYLWKAEKQDNGNIHFHITSNSFIHWRKLRTQWNKCCSKLGYLERCKTSDPNSTDVHSVRNIRQLPRYLASYMTKKDLYKTPLKRWHKRFKGILSDSSLFQVDLPKNYYNNIKSTVKCKHWDCSKLLLDNKLTVITDQANFNHDINLMEYNKVDATVTDHCIIWKLKPSEWNRLPAFFDAWKQFILEVRNHSKNSIALV